MKFLSNFYFVFMWTLLIGVNIHSVSTGQVHNESRRLNGPTNLPHVTGSLKLSLHYCQLRASLLNLTTTSRHCIKVWDHRYNKYCVKTSQDFDRQTCKGLWTKLSHLRTVWSKARLKSNWVRSRRKIRCGKARINQREFGCCDGASFELATQRCCGHRIYNTTTQDCCSGVIYELNSQGCCYNTDFSLKTEACCNTEVHQVGGRQDRLCCGDESIDAYFYFCLNDTVFMKQNFRKVNTDPEPTIVPTSKDWSSSLRNNNIILITVSVSASILIVVIVHSLFIAKPELLCKKVLSAYERVAMVGGSEFHAIPTVGDGEMTQEPTDIRWVDLQENTVNTTVKPPETELLNNEPPNAAKHVLIRSVSQYSVNDGISMPDMDEMLDDPGFVLPYRTEAGHSINKMATSTTTGTQTCEEKRYNIMNSLGRPFDVRHVFNANDKTLSIPNSAVTLTLSEKDSLEEKTCLASTFRNLYEITAKLKLDEKSCVASPAVEYHFVNTTLQGHAKVTMPFVGDFTNLTVLKIKSDQGLDVPLESKVIKRRDDVTREEGGDDEYYEIIGSGEIAIFVRSLSILTCLSPCHEKHQFSLTGYLYGKLVECPGEMRASIGMYIADEIRTIRDYIQLIEDAERKRGRIQLLTRRLPLPLEVNMQERLRLKLKIESPGWEHRTDSEYEVIQPSEQDISIQTITRCHKLQQSGLPFAKEWYTISKNFRSSSEVGQRIECILITAHVSTSGGESESDKHSVDTTLLYDDLIRQKAADLEKGVNRRAFPNQAEMVPPAGHIRQPESASEFEHEEVVLAVGRRV